MRVFVAGATGAIGVPIVRRLLVRGHVVVGLTRSRERARRVEELGASAAVASALDAAALERVVRDARPEAVIQLLTALPRGGPLRIRDLERTNRLRSEGTRNLLHAAHAAGARRYVAESVIFAYGYERRDGRMLAEGDRTDVARSPTTLHRTLEVMLAHERSVREAQGIEGVALRYGAFYGRDVGQIEFMVRMLRRRMLRLFGDGRGIVSWIHVEDGAEATIAALEGGHPGELYNVVDDEPVSFRDFVDELAAVAGVRRPGSLPMWLARLAAPYAAMVVGTADVRVSNDKLKRELGWSPRFPTYREGLADVGRRLTARTSGR